MSKFIHLLYVPTMLCNMGCKYCYLEDNTVDNKCGHTVLETLDYAVCKFAEEGVVPFNISLHGGEVTTLATEEFEHLTGYIADYYKCNRLFLNDNGFFVSKPHIKTNLYDIKRHLAAIKAHDVSISGSIDLPLSLHDKYRVTKGGESTLDRILENVKLLNGLDVKKKVSATLFKEHIENLDEIAESILFLHENTSLDMNDFNFMVGFDYRNNGVLHSMSEQEQTELFHYMHDRFDGTELDRGVNGPWFAEFGPDYCINCNNCGEKFFLLERNGDIYSCVRGQKHSDYYYGNIYSDSVKDILHTAMSKIFINHNRVPIDKECLDCPYLYVCKTGCPFVKNVYHQAKSYTCLLQKELYKKSGIPECQDREQERYSYLEQMHPDIAGNYPPPKEVPVFINQKLRDIVAEDTRLSLIYDDKIFVLSIDGYDYALGSQILKNSRDIVYITPESRVMLYVRKDALDAQCDYPQNNSLYIMLLSGDMIVYGDEGRTKQRHIMTHQIFKDTLSHKQSDREGFFCTELTQLIQAYKDELSEEPNNIFFTTSALRDYHYSKQKNNAYYHIQAIDLPFQNIEFYYIEGDIDD